MHWSKVKQNMRVRTNAVLGSTGGILLSPERLAIRKANALGTVYSWVPGHGGDVWYVVHDAPEGESNSYTAVDGTVSYRKELVTAYSFNEFEEYRLLGKSGIVVTSKPSEPEHG